MARYNVFVMGMTDFHRRDLVTVSEEVQFHDLLDVQRLIHQRAYDFDALLDQARAELDAFDGEVHAIIAQWDFPTSELVPILCRERGLPAPRLRSVVTCGHKYWSRLAQARSVPELTPGFTVLDPKDPQAAERMPLDYPCWIKPVKGYSSQLSFYLESRAELERVLGTIRAGIDRLASPYETVMRRVDPPAEISRLGAHACLVEEYLDGVEIAHEGFVFQGRTQIHGTLDMVRERRVFTRYEYPSSAPDHVKERIEAAIPKFLARIGFDNGCFNAEYFWNPETDEVHLVEINPRLSQSHTDLFAKVNGVSNYQVAIDIALGREPKLPPPGSGPYAKAAKFLVRTFEDGVVTRVPSPRDLARVQEVAPDTIVHVEPKVGDVLSEMVDQDAYTFELAEVYIGGDSTEDLLERYDRVLEVLDLRVADRVPETV